MTSYVGIDLGTANSCVAALEDGKPVILSDNDGRRTIPSIFAISSDGEPLIGHKAAEQAYLNKQNTIYAVKRLIGCKYDSPEITKIAKKLPYKVVPAKNGDARVIVNEKERSPEEVSANILSYIKVQAEKRLGNSVTKAVITVPAHFNDAQRQATKDAGKIAGLDVIGIVNEPTAAALAYGLHTRTADANGSIKNEEELSEEKEIREADKVIAVFDLGGGTFDISILRLKNGIFDVLSTQGDTFLGGEDMDQEIVRYILGYCEMTLGVDLEDNRDALQRIAIAARDAKHELSYEKTAAIKLPYLSSGMKSVNLQLERSELEEIVWPILSKTEKPCLLAMDDAGVTKADITDVILVGGQTKMPAVKKFCKKVFGKDPHEDVDPDAAVALGASVLAGIIEGELEGVSLQDVIPLSLNLEVQGGQVCRLMKRNTKVPNSVTRVFTTSAPDQPEVNIHVIQGESNFAPNNTSLGNFDLVDIEPAPRGYPEIAVSFAVDNNGILSVSAKDLDTGSNQNLVITPSSGLEEEELNELIKFREELEHQIRTGKFLKKFLGTTEDSANSSSDRDELVENLRQLIFTTQFNLDTYGSKFLGPKRILLDKTLENSRKQIATESSIEELSQSLKVLEDCQEELQEYIDEED